MTGAGPHVPAARAKRQAGLVRYTSSQRSPRASRLAARHSRSQASHASTNASDARRRKKSPWLGNFPNNPISTDLSGSALELPPVMCGERIADRIGRFYRDHGAMVSRLNVEHGDEIGFGLCLLGL